jgi:GNAT superfamily N-acetyltransferase
VRKVADKKDLKQFMMLSWKIYKNDPVWVAPIIADYKKVFDPKVSPFFLHGEMQYFLAEKNGELLGRVAAIRNRLHNETWSDKVGFFGFFECIDDQEVANALLDAAKAQLKEWGFDQMRGPASPSSNEDYGVLIDNFKDQQVLISTYNAPYYFKLYQAYGLEPIKELYAIRFPGERIEREQGDRLKKLKEMVLTRTGVHFENLNMKKFAEGVMTFKGIFNEAWNTNTNHGWVPLTEEEFDFITSSLKTITDPELVLIAKKDDKVVGGMICLPDWNEVFKSWKGNPFPFHWIDLFTKKRKIKCLRVVILGVLPEYQKKGLDVVMYYEVMRRGLDKGMEWAEASYIVEDNLPMFKPLMNIGGEIYKRYKVMEQAIA